MEKGLLFCVFVVLAHVKTFFNVGFFSELRMLKLFYQTFTNKWLVFCIGAPFPFDVRDREEVLFVIFRSMFFFISFAKL